MIFIFSIQTAARPADWNVKFGVDSMHLDPLIKTPEKTQSSLKTYLLRISPTILLNDQTSIKMELQEEEGTLQISQFFMILYTDIATYTIGRHPVQWALGAMMSSGEGLWDRYLTVRDGVTMNLQLGNIDISSFWETVYPRKTWGIAPLYHNKEKDIKIGVHYSRTRMNKQRFDLFDIYLERILHRFTFAAEIPIRKGKEQSTSGIVRTIYRIDKYWNIGSEIGLISGGKDKAITLHRNFNVAEILFKYDTDESLSLHPQVTNVNYFKFILEHSPSRWTWRSKVIYALAEHVELKQEKEYGLEFDLDFRYHLSSEVSIGGTLAYLITGKYYAFLDKKIRNPFLFKIDALCSF